MREGGIFGCIMIYLKALFGSESHVFTSPSSKKDCTWCKHSAAVSSSSGSMSSFVLLKKTRRKKSEERDRGQRKKKENSSKECTHLENNQLIPDVISTLAKKTYVAQKWGAQSLLTSRCSCSCSSCSCAAVRDRVPLIAGQTCLHKSES